MYNIINTARIHYIQAPSVLSVSLTFSLSYVLIYILLVSLPSFPLYRVQRDPRRKSRLRVRSAVYLSYAGENLQGNCVEQQATAKFLRAASAPEHAAKREYRIRSREKFSLVSSESWFCLSPCSWKMRNVHHYRLFNGIVSNVFDERRTMGR